MALYNLCSLAQVKRRLEIDSADTEHDALLADLIAEASAEMARRAGRVIAGRPCLVFDNAARGEWFSPPPRCRTLWLTARPVAFLTQIKEAVYEAFDDADALVEGDDYQIDWGTGRLTRVGEWLAGERTVQVIYVGGYYYAEQWLATGVYTSATHVQDYGEVFRCTSGVGPSETRPGSDSDHWTAVEHGVPLPDDVVGKAVKQVAHDFQRRRELGLTSVGMEGGSVSRYSREGLLPDVDALMLSMRRAMG